MSTRKRTREDAGLVGNLEQVSEAQRETKKRRINEEVPQIIAFLEALRAANHPENPKKRNPKQRRPAFKVLHTVEMKAFVVWLRFGSLTAECKTALRKIREIFRILLLNECFS